MRHTYLTGAIACCLTIIAANAQTSHSYKQFVCEKGGVSVNYNYGIKDADKGKWVIKPLKFKKASKIPGAMIIRACDMKQAPSVWAGYMWIKGESLVQGGGRHILTSGWYKLNDDGSVTTIVPNGKYEFAANCNYATTPLFICSVSSDLKNGYDVIDAGGNIIASGKFTPFIGVSADKTYIFQKWADGHWTVIDDKGAAVLKGLDSIEPLASDEEDLSVHEADYVRIRQAKDGKWGLASIDGARTLDCKFNAIEPYEPDDDALAISGVDKFKAGYPFVKAQIGDRWGIWSRKGTAVIPAILEKGDDGTLDEAMKRLPFESYSYWKNLQDIDGNDEARFQEDFCKYCINVVGKGECDLSYGGYNSDYGMLGINCSATPRSSYWLAVNRDELTAFELAFNQMRGKACESIRFFISDDGLSIAEMTFKIPEGQKGEKANPLAGKIFKYMNPAFSQNAKSFTFKELK